MHPLQSRVIHEPPDTPVFNHIKQHNPCGAVELAGTAVGAAFVGVTAACLAVAEGVRTVLAGDGHDLINLHLHTNQLNTAPATGHVDIIPARLNRAP